MIAYKQTLELELKQKKQKLLELYESRKDEHSFRENFWHIQSGINSLEVDVATIKSRIENLHKSGINLPDHETSQTVNKYK